MANVHQVSVDKEDTVSRETFPYWSRAACSLAGGTQLHSGSHMASEALELERRPAAADRGG